MRIFSTKNVLPHWVGPTTRSENLCRNINSGYALVSRETSSVNLGLLTIQCWGFSVSLTAAIVPFCSLLLSFSECNTWRKRQDTPCVIPRLFLDPENTAAFSHCFLPWLFNRCTWRRWSLKESNSATDRAISLEFMRHLYHTRTSNILKLISYCPVYIASLIKFDVIISSNPILVSRDVILGQWRLDVGLMRRRCGVGVGSMKGSIWGRCGVDVGSMWGPCGVHVRSM